MVDPKDDTPLGQAVRSLIDMAAKVASDEGYGTHVVNFQKGRIETVKVDRSYRFPDIPCSPAVRGSRSSS